MLDLSVIIITKNEELRLPVSLASLPKGAEVIVVDSGSVDRTVEIAQSAGAVCIQRSFDNYANQKNKALSLATRSWVLSLDADEELSSSLSRAIVQRVNKTFDEPDETSNYRLARRLKFMGRVMRFGKTCDAPIRLFKKNSGRFVGDIHEKFVPDCGRIGPVFKAEKADMIVHTSYQDLADYFEKMNRYTTAMALTRVDLVRGQVAVFKFCVRPFFEFLSRYIFRLGFLDGYPGYCYAILSSIYVLVKYAKARELVQR